MGKWIFLFVIFCFLKKETAAQTDNDAIMMNKHQWCNGITCERSQWKNYWEGTLRRDNENIGTLTSQGVVFMSNYGIRNNLNVMVGLPYIWNHVSGGTLHRMSGLQDASLYLKWQPVKATFGEAKLSVFGVGGFSTPTHRYVVDFLPLAIGLGTTNLSGRAMVDIKIKTFSATASAAYIIRSNTTTDRNAYYTDHMIYSDKIEMPNVANYMLRAGLRSKYLIAEAIINKTETLGGFDIRRNDMPFPGNRMNATSVGAHLKYTLPRCPHVELTADGSRIIAGRNVGQATNLSAGAFYLFSFKKKTNIRS